MAATAEKVMEEELARLAAEMPKRAGASDWCSMSESQMRSLLDVRHRRPLLEWRHFPTLRKSQRPSANESAFRTFCLNLIFNRGSLPGLITEPEKEITDGLSHPRRNLLWRAVVRHALDLIDPRLDHDAYRLLMRERCKQDPVFFTNGFAWAYNDRAPEAYRTMPFILWDRQEEILRAIDAAFREALEAGCGLDVIDEKGREVGMTQLFCTWILQRWLYWDDSAVCTTLEEAKLDNRQLDSVFGKMRFILQRLPAWLMPYGWTPECWKATNGYSNTARLIKPQEVPGTGTWKAEGAAIEGATAKGETGTGRRKTIAFFDEFAVLGAERPGLDSALWEQCADTVVCRIANSTPRGRQTHHAHLMEDSPAAVDFLSESTARRKTLRFRINWRDDPRKNKGAYWTPFRPINTTGRREYWGLLHRLHVLETTGRKDEQEYRDITSRCRVVDLDLEPHERDWASSPWHSGEWYDRCRTAEGARRGASEIEGTIEDSEIYLFNRSRLARMPKSAPALWGDFKDLRTNYRMAEFRRCPGPIQVWKQPQEGRWYLIVVDAGFGIGRDYSVAHVFDATEWPLEQVAMFRDNETPPVILALYVWALAGWYNGGRGEDFAFVCHEANVHGIAMIQKLLCECQFPRRRCYCRKDEHPDDPYDVSPYGVYHQADSRIAGMSAFHAEFERDPMPVLFHDEITLEEFSHIQAHEDREMDTRCQPDEGHDDCVMAAIQLVPALRGFNYVEFGERLFEVMGERMNAKLGVESQYEASEDDEDFDGPRDRAVPIWKKRRALVAA